MFLHGHQEILFHKIWSSKEKMRQKVRSRKHVDILSFIPKKNQRKKKERREERGWDILQPHPSQRKRQMKLSVMNWKWTRHKLELSWIQSIEDTKFLVQIPPQGTLTSLCIQFIKVNVWGFSMDTLVSSSFHQHLLPITKIWRFRFWW